MTRVAVVGAGVAGLAAAWAARRAGAEVTVVAAGTGASALGGGAVDDRPWERALRAAAALGAIEPMRELEADVVALSRELGLWELPGASSPQPHLGTLGGRLRPARGHDRALLDLAFLEGARVLLPRADRPGWDADLLARALAAAPFARARGLTFAPVAAPVLRFADEHRIPDGDLAARHDEPARLAWLAERLAALAAAETRRGAAVHAVLLGPWLGAAAPRAAELSARAGVRAGEALAGAGSPAGLRFEAARDGLLGAIGCRVVRERAGRVLDSGAGLRVELARPSEGGRRAESFAADAVVLAIGGLAGGGVIYDPPEHGRGAELPARAGVPFALSLEAPVSLATDDHTVDVVSSLFGPDLDVTAWPSGDRDGDLESVGIRCRGVRAGDGVFAAGEAIAGRPRTLLEAVASGVRAGREAAASPDVAPTSRGARRSSS